MKINIKATNFELTPSLKEYAEEKLGTLEKFIQKFAAEGVAEIWLEVARTTRHHHKGENLFMAEADLRLPNRILRGEEYAEEIHAAIDRVRDTLRLEIEKYKTQFDTVRRERKEK